MSTTEMVNMENHPKVIRTHSSERILIARITENYSNSCWKTWARLVMLPNHPFLKFWRIFLLFLLLYVLIILPIRIAFNNEDIWVDYVIDGLFLIDIIVTFITAYPDNKGAFVVDPRRISLAYLKSYFFLDVISTFPFYFVTSRIGQFFTLLRFPKLIRLLKVMRLLKLIRARRFRIVWQYLEYSPFVPVGLVRAIRLLSWLLAFTHFTACMWFFVGEILLDIDIPGESWLTRFGGGIIEEPATYQYLASAYWSLTTLTTVGFGDITPQTSVELGFTMFMMLMGTTIFSYTTATLSSIITDYDKKASLLRSNMHSLREFMDDAGLDDNLRKEAVREMTRVWRKRINEERDWTELLLEMPPHLANRCVEERYKSLIEESETLTALFNVAPLIASEILKSMNPIHRVAETDLARDGEDITCFYILSKGNVNSVTDSIHYDEKNVRISQHIQYGPGDFIGLDEAFGRKRKWPFMAHCVKDCDLFAIPIGKLDDLKGVPQWTQFKHYIDERIQVERRESKSVSSVSPSEVHIDPNHMLQRLVAMEKNVEILTETVVKLDQAFNEFMQRLNQ